MKKQRSNPRFAVQASWRLTRQEMGLVLLAIGVLVLGALLQLYLVSRIALTGREIFVLQDDLAETQQVNEGLRLHLAEMSAYDIMAARATQRGYQVVPPEQRTYVFVDGYSPPEPAVPHTDFTGLQQPETALPPAYTQSLLDWVFEKLNAYAFQTGGR